MSDHVATRQLAEDEVGPGPASEPVRSSRTGTAELPGADADGASAAASSVEVPGETGKSVPAAQSAAQGTQATGLAAPETLVQGKGAALPSTSLQALGLEKASVDGAALEAGGAVELGPRWLLAGLALVAVAAMVAPAFSAGLWDPHELTTAELARRIAGTVFGASGLAVQGANNGLPTSGELGRGELPFTSIALGFRLFGLHAWAGRVPLLLWGLLGLGATYVLVRRMVDQATALLSVCVLATTPLYFLHARTLLGDIVAMASCAVAVAGLTIAVFDATAGPLLRAVALFVGALGLLAGFGARGLLLGVAVPAAAVASAALVWVANGRRWAEPVGARLAWVVAFLALAAAARGSWVVLTAREGTFVRSVGATVLSPRTLPTHDALIAALGHSLLPYSTFLPFALGSALLTPVPPAAMEHRGAEQEAALSLRLVLLLLLALATAAYGLVAPRLGSLPFAPVFAAAVLVAVALRELTRRGEAARTLSIAVLALGVLFYTDFKNSPDKGLTPFGVAQASFPESFAARGLTILGLCLGLLALFGLALVDGRRESARFFRREDYLAWPRTLRDLFAGNFGFGVIVAEATLVVLRLLSLASDHHFHWRSFSTLWPLFVPVVAYGYLALPALVVSPLAALLVRDATRWSFVHLRVARGTVAAAALVAFGLALSSGYYPALANQISPKDAFEAYRKHAAPGEDVASFGAKSGSAVYYTGKQVPSFAVAREAHEWLMGGGAARRWLILRTQDLPELNSLYRAASRPRANLPILDGTSSEALLASSRLLPGERDQNPVAGWLPSARPQPAHPLAAELGIELRVLGWEIRKPGAEVVSAVTVRRRYEFRVCYEVTGRVSQQWETFIHIDGFKRRFNGDHPTLQNKYPLRFLQVGDFVVDSHEFELDPSFTPGDYEVFFGLFKGARRLEVRTGSHHENRLRAGMLRVE